VKKAMIACYHRLFLWWCWSEEAKNNLLPLPNLCVREEEDNGNALLSSSVVSLEQRRWQ
jgi:hypothetical protein